MNKSPTELFLTVDTEFSIAGAFGDFNRFKPVADPLVACEIEGREHGLGFMLDCLARHKARATFFVETLNAAYFGPEPMGRFARRIIKAGHDVQLHLHPCWLAFEDGKLKPRGQDPWPPNDSCAGRSLEDMSALIRYGLGVFEAWGVPRPVALRTGGLKVDRTVYKAQQAIGVPLASNICMAVSPPSEAALQKLNGLHRIEDVMEAPVLSFYDLAALGRQRLRPLQVTAVGSGEMMTVLRRARRAGVNTIVIITHPFEYVKAADRQYKNLRPNRLVQSRLANLCKFVAENGDDFRWSTFHDKVASWPKAEEQPQTAIEGKLSHTLIRTFENAVNDRI